MHGYILQTSHRQPKTINTINWEWNDYFRACLAKSPLGRGPHTLLGTSAYLPSRLTDITRVWMFDGYIVMDVCADLNMNGAIVSGAVRLARYVLPRCVYRPDRICVFLSLPIALCRVFRSSALFKRHQLVFVQSW